MIYLTPTAMCQCQRVDENSHDEHSLEHRPSLLGSLEAGDNSDHTLLPAVRIQALLQLGLLCSLELGGEDGK